MTTWVALLRGINLGRNKRLTMSDLRDLLESLGYDEVRTHLQSGNAVFTATRATGPALEQRIGAELDKALGLECTVMVRSAKELDSVVKDNPFTSGRHDPKQLQAAFLSAKPSAARVKSLDRAAYAPDDFEFGDRVIYLRMPNGFQGSKLPDWEKALGLRATVRTWNTVTRLRALAVG